MNSVVATDEYGNILNRDVYVGDTHISLGLGYSVNNIVPLILIVTIILLGVLLLVKIKKNKSYKVMGLNEILSEIGEKPYKIVISDCGRTLATFFYKKDNEEKAVTYEIDKSDINYIMGMKEVEVQFSEDGLNV